MLAGSSYPIVVRIFGPNLDVLRRTAKQVEGRLADVNGVSEAQVELQENVPQINVAVDLAKARHYGVKPGDVRRAAATLVAGEEVGDFFRTGKAYDVQVWSPPEDAQQPDRHPRAPDRHAGRRARPRSLSWPSVRVRPTPNVVHRENASRSIDVGVGVAGRDLGSVVGDVQQSLREVEFPLQYHAEVLGEYAERQKTQQRLLWFALARRVRRVRPAVRGVQERPARA